MGQNNSRWRTRLERVLICAFVATMILGAWRTHWQRQSNLRFSGEDVHVDDGFIEEDLHQGVSGLPFSEVSRPVIGILTQPAAENDLEYIAASYVKYAEAAGLRVVPLRYGWSDQKLVQTIQGLNGVLFPGGGASIDPKTSKIFRAASIIFREAEKLNKAGRKFPIWGTCLGWELIATLSSSYSILTDSGHFLHPGVSSSLHSVERKSKIFKDMRPFLFGRVELGQKFFYYSHEFGVTPEIFNKSLDSNCWKIVAVSSDLTGKKFVAAAESTCRPYYGVQFHPEKALFEWYNKADIPHSYAATEVSRHFVSFLAKEVRSSRPTHVKDNWVFDNDIHHYKLTTLGDSYFYQMYVFSASNSTNKVGTPDDDWNQEKADDWHHENQVVLA